MTNIGKEIDLSDMHPTDINRWSLRILEEDLADSYDFELALLVGVVALRLKYGLDIYEEVYEDNYRDTKPERP